MIRLALLACLLIALASAAIAQIGMAPFQPFLLMTTTGQPTGAPYFAFAGSYGSAAMARTTLQSGVPTGGYINE